MYYLGEPLVDERDERKNEKRRSLLSGVAIGFGLAAVVGIAAQSQINASPASFTTALFGASAGCAEGGPKAEPLSIGDLQAANKAFIDSLGDDIKGQVYYEDASKQFDQWQICTIVQQCLVPKYGLPVGRLEPESRTKLYDIFALVLSDESYKRVMVQQLSNLLLGEMQTWATTCPGRCEELDDKDGFLPAHLLQGDAVESHTLNASYKECGDLNTKGKRFTFWRCDDSPRMLHHGNIDTVSGLYKLGNVFLEPTIHGRNNHFDYIAVYGSMAPGEPFGFRYSGHHFDLSFSVDASGTLSDMPTFLGHNPLVVPKAVPPPADPKRGATPDDYPVPHEADYLQWHNMAGVPQFPDAVKVMLDAAAVLPKTSSYIPLKLWDSTASNGGLTLKEGKELTDYDHLDLSTADEETFEKIWALIDYTLEFTRGGRPRPERALFRSQGKMVWTTCHFGGDDDNPMDNVPLTFEHLVGSRSFFYVRVETDELLYFCMVNSLFSLMLETEPSNHLHSLIIPKKYLPLAARPPEGRR